jgi:hypothetical protein
MKAPVLTDDDGFSAGQKFFLLGLVVGACALFLRFRGGSATDRLKAKSMA